LSLVAVLVSLGLALQGTGYALGRQGHAGPVQPLFFAGLVLIFAPCAWRLLDPRAIRRERLQVSMLLGLALLASYVLRSPLIFDSFDELLHGATLANLVHSRTLFTTNTALPVSPFYPGLELLTASVMWITGLPLVLAQVVVLAVARLLLVLGVFLVVERVAGSARAGGIGVLAYAASPQFYSFNAQYAYQTLAIALSVAAVHLLLSEIDSSSSGLARRRGLALACVAGAVVTHHITGWLTVACLVVWAIGLRLGGRRQSARIVGIAASAGFVVAAAWTGMVGGRLVTYIRPILQDASSGFATAIGHMHSNRHLFVGASGASSPLWEIVLMLAAAVAWCLLLMPSSVAVLRRKTVGRSWLRLVPVAVAACYPLTLLASLSSYSSEVGQRASTFVFFGVALVVGAWLALRQSTTWSRRRQLLAVPVACVCFVGSMMYGSGPSSAYLTGPYLVGADQRSMGAPSIAAAQWVSGHLPAGSRIASDRVNGALLADLGHADPVTAASGLVNVGQLYFAREMGPYQLSLVREANIRYLLVDNRLAEGPPLFGVYFEPGETPAEQRLTPAELDKFRNMPGVRLMYDNGPIQIYDLSSVLGLSPFTPVGGMEYAQSGTGTDWLVFGVACGVGLLWLRRLGRRAPPSVEDIFAFLAAGTVAGILFGFLVVPTSLPPSAVGMAALVVLGALSCRPLPRPSKVNDHRRRRPQPGVVLAAALTAVLVGGAVAAASLTARSEWSVPTQLALQYVAPGQVAAEIHLGSASVLPARLDVVRDGQVMFSKPLANAPATVTIELPSSVTLGGPQVRLVTGGHVLREVQA
jgi:hypothetical protein